MIRDATPHDIPALLEIGRKFADAASIRQSVGFDEESLAATLQMLMDSPQGILLITDDGTGAAGGMVHPSIFNHGHLTGQELFWWADGQGMALLDALENRAKALGAQTWSMITLEAIRPEATGRLYRRRGYRPLEHSYIREF